MKRQMPFRIIIMLATVALLLVLSGCGAKTVSQGSNTSQEPAPVQEPEPAKPEVIKEKINVYFAADDDLTALKEQQVEIQYETNDQKFDAAFKALQQDGANGEMSLWKKVELLHTKLASGALTIDVHLPDEARFGAPGEELAMQSIQKTMFQFDDVSSLDILVDGEQVDSLMGHDSLDHPIVKPTTK
ncbi:hypothetical protein Back11_10210 [Paenibacillus baekrokdamisoli]|uniref:GerMN domain-containing protein n=1 Tax=Paenibacillus baekrokdamisoli TaxID=1712516 RepID=A0A3G9IN04_9BACL|nr:GerMN domain-containing protein [Paenibacillus baekrokdamisoli]MBB3067131.1 spore germination protein GerM [Paenibacillus baekrokdamisoli]BBH19676.1 hypothetical protein Back11_10210 [Paenibacillus baekrokdamisoli]